MNANLTRLYTEENQTRGILHFIEDEINIFDCVTIELPWLENQKNISCIPEGKYHIKKHISPKFGQCLKVQDVPGRSEILIHVGNYKKDTHGCILVGKRFTDINKDGVIDISESGNTMKKILAFVPDEFELLIDYEINW